MEKGMVLKLAFEIFGVEFRKETLALLLIEIPFHYFLIFFFLIMAWFSQSCFLTEMGAGSTSLVRRSRGPTCFCCC